MYKRKPSPTSFSHADRLCDQLRIEQQQSNLLAAKTFLEAILETKLCDDLHKELQDGVALCRLINCMKPDTVSSIGRKNIPFVKMANISLFLQGAKDLGLQNSDLFQTVDLYEAKDMTAVINTILTLARICNKDTKLNSGSLGNQRELGKHQLPDVKDVSQQRLSPQGSQNTHRHVKNIFNQQQQSDQPQLSLSMNSIYQHHQSSLDLRGDISTNHITNEKVEGLRHTRRHLTQKTAPSASSTRDVKQQAPLTNDSGYGSLSRQRQNSCSTPTQIMDALYDDEDGNRDYMDAQISEPKCPSKVSSHLQVLGVPFIVRKRFSQASLNNHLDPSVVPRRPSPPAKSGSDPIIDNSSVLPPYPVPSRSTPPIPHTLSAPPSPPSLSKKNRISSIASSQSGYSPVCTMEPSLQEKQQNKGRLTQNENGCITPTSTFTKNKSAGLRNQRRLTVRISLRKRGKPTKRSTHFLLGDCVGKGQFGSVYRALDMQTGEIVAVKRILVEDAKVEDEIMQEVNLLRGMTCPHIVRYIGFAQDDTYMNIVLEYVENGSLLSTLKAFGSLPEKLVASYTYKILKGLEYLHNHDVVHCDLKAANILTTKTGDIKLTDFGVSLNLKIKQEDGKGTPAGTPNWMAPEVIEMKGACPKSDIWSLACTITELLTGKPPFAHLIAMSTLYHIVEDDCPPLPLNISKNLQDFMLLCFQKDPACRPTAAALLEHPWLHSVRSESGQPSSPTDSANQPFSPIETEKRVDEHTVNAKTIPTNVNEWNSNQQHNHWSNTDDDEDEIDNEDTNSQVTILTYSDDLLELVNQHQTHLFEKTRLEEGVTCRVCHRKAQYYAWICKGIRNFYFPDCAFVCHEGCTVKATRCFASLGGLNQNMSESIEPKDRQAWVSSVSPFGVTTFEPSSFTRIKVSPILAPPIALPSRPAFPSHSSSNRLQRFFGIRKKEDQRQGQTGATIDKPHMYNVLKATKSVPLLRESQKLQEEERSRTSLHPYQRHIGGSPSNYNGRNRCNHLPSPSPSPSSSTSLNGTLPKDKRRPSLGSAPSFNQHLAPSAAWKISSETRPKRRTKSLQTDTDCIIS